MGSILNGMSLHGGLIPYGATFLVFSDYMRPADGPTHQPIEHLAALRTIPNLTVIRPCDANETAEAWRFAIQNKKGPVALVLTRQNTPTLDREIFAAADELQRGAYILSDAKDAKPDVILLASGSEVHIALQAADILTQKDISVRVVSMPSWELFDHQPETYRREVLPPQARIRIAIEAGIPQGWHRYVGSNGEVVGLDHFGASAPFQTLYDKFGITAKTVVEKALALLG
jgi:transketolase